MTTIFASLLLAAAVTAHNTTNIVVMVDQNKNLNVEGIASVQDISSNAVKVAIANAAAQAAQDTARQVSASIDGVVGNIMSNNVVIYRSGFTDSFAALVIFTDSDIIAINNATWHTTASTISVDLSYVSTANIGATKPLVYGHNTCVAKENFEQIPDANVTNPVYHPGEIVFQEQTFSGYYTMSVSVPNPSSTSSYFLWLKLTGDQPGGEGTTLDLPNGVTGGSTLDVEWGGYLLHFKGGLLKGYQDAN